jgi:hypothetical protein
MYIDGMASRMVAPVEKMVSNRIAGLYWGIRHNAAPKYTEATSPFESA